MANVFNILPVSLGKQEKGKPVRRYTLHQTIKFDLAIRRRPWKYLDHKGSGENNYEEVEWYDLSPFALPEKAPNAPFKSLVISTKIDMCQKRSRKDVF
ncbi:MAG: hypothetical protein ACYTFK_09940 [Planctomycetota bacterium]|jgi:hypothetical protein